jgi:hypothetical protein
MKPDNAEAGSSLMLLLTSGAEVVCARAVYLYPRVVIAGHLLDLVYVEDATEK